MAIDIVTTMTTGQIIGEVGSIPNSAADLVLPADELPPVPAAPPRSPRPTSDTSAAGTPPAAQARDAEVAPERMGGGAEPVADDDGDPRDDPLQPRRPREQGRDERGGERPRRGGEPDPGQHPVEHALRPAEGGQPRAGAHAHAHGWPARRRRRSRWSSAARGWVCGTGGGGIRAAPARRRRSSVGRSASSRGFRRDGAALRWPRDRGGRRRAPRADGDDRAGPGDGLGAAGGSTTASATSSTTPSTPPGRLARRPSGVERLRSAAATVTDDPVSRGWTRRSSAAPRSPSSCVTSTGSTRSWRATSGSRNAGSWPSRRRPTHDAGPSLDDGFWTAG